MRLERTVYGQMPDGREIQLFTCRNKNGLVIKLTDYGAILVSVETPDRSGQVDNITLGFPSLDEYLQHNPFFGATVGRYANRIGNARFTLDGREYTLAANNGPNHLHGGIVGFDKVVWSAEPFESANAAGVRFRRTSPAGEEGYPGNLSVTAIYTLNDSDELRMEFIATTDEATPVNLTNHAYWNLAGAGSGDVLDQVMMIVANHYLAVDSGLIPTGELVPVEGTPLDFRTPKPIGAEIDQIDIGGYDHCYVLGEADGTLSLAARVQDPGSGRAMEIYTTQPGMQFYSGNFLDGSPQSGGFDKHHAFCLETQHYPDSPNKPDFPSTILRPGEEYRQVTVHRFYTE